MRVADGLGRYVLVEREFAAGDEVLLDFRREAVTVEGEDASADVAVESTFFSLVPGEHTLTFTGCSAHTVAWTERWL
ncbi:phage distal tail protein [Olsenella sp. Marseille-QA0557]|uniref:phage distal tail protein n=1 Tax=Olsenella sp. Marseille-QA0557 TaxID=3378782 RepID=UPI003D0F662F